MSYTQPLVSVGALQRALSKPRLAAYGDPAADPVGTTTKYLWNLSLASAIQPALHTLEVTFRNEIYRVSKQILKIDRRSFSHRGIDSWLDAEPTWLETHEQEKVNRAKASLGNDARSQTEGHLVSKLDLGFWTALCRQPYADWRAAGPRLWPRTLNFAFQHRPADVSTQSQIHTRFNSIREFRNRVAHHEPIWDRDYLGHHERIVDSIGWMNPSVAEAVRITSPAPAAYTAGPDPLRPYAESLVGLGPGYETTLATIAANLSPDRRALLEDLARTLSVANGRASGKELALTWAKSLG